MCINIDEIHQTVIFVILIYCTYTWLWISQRRDAGPEQSSHGISWKFLIFKCLQNAWKGRRDICLKDILKFSGDMSQNWIHDIIFTPYLE